MYLTPTGVKALSIGEACYSPYYDIVWSFDYYLSGALPSTEFGFCVFLQNADYQFYGGSAGIDLGYSGLSSFANETGYPGLEFGLYGALIGVGFDSTGGFAVSANNSTNTKLIRDGITEASVIPNSISVRAEYPTFSYNKYSTNFAITGFNVVDASKKTIRARLADLGSVLIIDYRYSPDDEFVNLLTLNVNLSAAPNSRFRPGVSFTKPVSTFTTTTSAGKIVIDNLHTEGVRLSATLVQGSTNVTTISTLPCYNTQSSIITAVPEIPISYPPFLNELCTFKYTDNSDSATSKACLLSGRNYCADSNLGGNNDTAPDYYNFGHYIDALVNGTTRVVLTRTDYFTYKNGAYTLSLSSMGDTWKLINGGATYVNNGGYTRPVGSYTSSTSLSYF